MLWTLGDTLIFLNEKLYQKFLFFVVFGHKTEDCDDEEVTLPLNVLYPCFFLSVYLLQYQ